MRLLKNIFLSLGIFFISSCCEKVEIKNPVNPQLKATVPYIEGQSVSFSSNWGNTIETVVKYNNNQMVDCGDCCESETWEYYETLLRTTSGQVYNFASLYTNFTAQQKMDIEITVQASSSGSTWGNQFQYYIKEDGSLDCRGSTLCHPSITINNRVNYNVIEMRQLDYSGGGERYIYSTLYSKEKGFLRFTYNNGEVFTLNE